MTIRQTAADLWKRAREYGDAHPEDEVGCRELASELESEAKQMDPYPTQTMQAVNQVLIKRFDKAS